MAAAILAVIPTTVTGQQLPNISTDQLLQLQQQYGQSGQGAPNTPVGNQNLPQPITLQPAVPAIYPIPISRLEQILSRRAGVQLQQFGYDQLGRSSSIQVPQSGAVQDDYLLGPGDEIIVSLRGQDSNELRSTVDRNGQLVLPRLPPISATGRTLGSFRQDVEAAVHRAYIVTDASVSVGRIRQISVLVSGEVNNPGQRLLTGLNSAIDALQLSGGVKKTGSLRNIRVQRGNREITMDLYNVLTSQGGASSMRLADGDHIIVPPLGQTVAVAGLIRRPGIYELAPHAMSISVSGLLDLAGGEEERNASRLSLLRFLPDGHTELVSLSEQATSVRDGEILFVQLSADQTSGQVMLSGGSSLAGNYPITSVTKLSDVVKLPGALGNLPYTPFGIIVRKDPLTLTRSLVAFTPVEVLRGSEDQVLQKEDIIRPLSTTEAQILSFIVHTYLSRLMADQNLIHNPLNQGITNGSNIVSNALVSQTEDASAELNDLSSVPSDIQRREINALLDTGAPGGLLARQQQEAARENQLAAVRQGVQQTSSTSMPGNGSQQQQQQQQQTVQGSMPGYSIGQQQVLPDSSRGSGYSEQHQILPDAISGSQKSELASNFMDQPVGPGQFASNQEIETFGQFAQQLGIDPLILVNFLVDHRARLDGGVRGPGFYFVGPSITLSDLVQAAGGTANWADESGVELLSTIVDTQTGQATSSRQKLPLRSGTLSTYVVRPRDQLRFPQVFNEVSMGSVTVQGEVRYPGNYPILRGEHLSDLMMRVGGLSNNAYPYGAIFLRKSAAQIERDGYVRAANDMENQLISAMTRIGTDKIDPSTFASMQSFVNDLRNQQALGRISITVDPSLLAANAAVDPVLEAGDVIYVPQRPSTISVLGQVLQSGSYPYKAGRSVEDYIAIAGGVSRLADASNTFIVLPDGSARKYEKSWLHFDAADILPPGSAIVVPRDVTPLDLRQTILDVSQILSQFAVSIASVAVLSKQ